METIKDLTIEVKKRQATYFAKEAELCKHVLGLLSPMYPQVVKVDISPRGVTIYTSNDSGRFEHEIKVNNDADWNDKTSFVPKLSWFSTQASVTNVSVLNYLEVLGYIAKEMKNFDSVLFRIFNSHVIELARLEVLVNDIYTIINKIEYDAKEKVENERKANFEKMLNDNEYFINTYVGRVRTTYKIIKVIKVSKKTTTIMRTDNFRSYTIDSLVNNSFTFNRLRNDERYNEFKDYKPTTLEEMKELAEYQRKEIES